MSSDLSYEIQLIHSTISLGTHDLEVDPLPGAEITVNEQSYLVMERRNRYRLKVNRYTLSHILLLVKIVQRIQDKSWHDGQWVIGDIACRFNARSPLVRCAVNPDGPCDTCRSFQIEPTNDLNRCF